MPIRDKLFLVLGGVLLGLVCTEVFLATFLPQPDFSFYTYWPGGYVFNKPNFSNPIALIPSAKKTITSVSNEHPVKSLLPQIQQYIMAYRTNNAGFRNNQPVDYKKIPGQYRILHLGDSLGLGFPLTVEESYANRLEKLTGSEVLNASTIFTFTARMLQYYQKEGYKYDPDMVVVQLTMSQPNQDFLSLDASGKSSFELDSLAELGKLDSVKGLISKDEAGVDQLVWNVSESTKPLFTALDEKFIRVPWMYHYSNILRLLIARANTSKIGVLTQSSVNNSQYVPYVSENGPAMPIINEARIISNMHSKFTHAYLQTFQEMLKAGRKPFVIVLIPNRYGCEGKTNSVWTNLIDELIAEGNKVMNFYPDFCDSATNTAKEEFYLPQEFHINAAAHTFIAERLVKEVVALKNADSR